MSEQINDPWLAAIAKAQKKMKLARMRAKMSPIPVNTMSVQQAMGYSGLGRTTIYNLIGDGTIDTIKVGGRRFIKIDSMKRLMGDV